MEKRTIFCLIAFSLISLTVNAGFKNVKLLYGNNFDYPEDVKSFGAAGKTHFASRRGVKGSGALFFRTKNRGTDWLTLSLDPNKFKGKMVQVSATISAKDLERGSRPYFGPKVMLYYQIPGKRGHYPEPKHNYGTYSWKKVSMVVKLPTDLSVLKLTLGIQGATGELRVDNVRIWECEETDEPAPPPKNHFNREAARLPRGKFKGATYRGFMSGSDLSPAAFKQLQDWHVNLLRYQMRPGRGQDISTQKKYLAWIDSEIKKMDKIVAEAGKCGIKVVLDLHRGPGTKVNKVASNILGAGTNVETLSRAWQKIAEHFKENPVIYGYDILNEPVNTTKLKENTQWQKIAEHVVKVIRDIDPDTPIIVEPCAAINDFTGMKPINAANIIYSPHFYEPFSFTHQGVHSPLIRWSYPGYINGVYWNREQLRLSMKSAIEFQYKYKVRIYVGEFGVINWAQGGDKYLADLISLFEEYGWDWTFHAFREWVGWSIEHQGDRNKRIISSADNPRKQVIIKALSKNIAK